MVSIKKTLLPVVLSLLQTTPALAGKAPENDDNPKKAVGRANLDKGKTKGIIEFSTAKNGTVKVSIDVTGIPETGGPFYYHIHKNKVGANGNCEDVGTHLNPYNAPLDDCDSLEDNSYCQVGDLSGKHGWFDTTCYQASYYDPYLSLNPDNKAYVIGRSVTLHFANMTKIACGNIDAKKKKKMKFIHKRDANEEEDDEYENQGLLSLNNATSDYKKNLAEKNSTVISNPAPAFNNKTNLNSTKNNVGDDSDSDSEGEYADAGSLTALNWFTGLCGLMVSALI